MAAGKGKKFTGKARTNGGPKPYTKTIGAHSDGVHHENASHHNFKRAGKFSEPGEQMSTDKRGC